MLPRLGPRLLAVALPLALLAPAAVHAEKVVTEDAVGDVQALDFDSDEDYLPAPDDVATDISRTVAAYGGTRLKVTVHFRDLQNTAIVRTDVIVRTPQGGYFMSLVREPGKRAKASFGRPRGGGVPLECRGLAGRFDGAADTVVLSAPAACFGAPRWVQLGVTMVGAEVADLDAGDLIFYVDDAHRDTLRDAIAKGPRIRRG